MSRSPYEVVFTMSRAASDAEWTELSRHVGAWVAQCHAAQPALFAGAVIELSEAALHVELAGSEDLILERAGTVHIWSARASSFDATRVLAGVLLCAQFVLTADVIQLSGSKAGAWQAAAQELAPLLGGEYAARVMLPRRHKADALVYLDAGQNAQILRDYFRTHLELSDDLLPDRDFKDTLAVDTSP